MSSNNITHLRVAELVRSYIPMAQEVEILKEDVRGILREMLGDNYPESYAKASGCESKRSMVRPDLGSWFWKCEKSPVGVCVYDSFWDRAHDFCVFCGEPEERK